IQRFIEMVRSFPELPLWMALSAALPINWSPILVYFGITIILGLLDWPGLARAVRSKLLALREEDFATAAILMGASPARVIGRHGGAHRVSIPPLGGFGPGISRRVPTGSQGAGLRGRPQCGDRCALRGRQARATADAGDGSRAGQSRRVRGLWGGRGERGGEG